MYGGFVRDSDLSCNGSALARVDVAAVARTRPRSFSITADANTGAPLGPVGPLTYAGTVETDFVAVFIRVADNVLIVEVVDEHNLRTSDRAVGVEKWNVD